MPKDLHKPAAKAEEPDKAPEAEETKPDAPEEQSSSHPEQNPAFNPPEPQAVIALVPEYDGPEPVYVSVTGADEVHNRVELDKTGVGVPAKDADSFTSLPYVEAVE